MSHFSVMVRIPSETPIDKIEEAIGRVLDPYCEHDDNGRLKHIMKFNDTEDESRKAYETESREMVKLEDGTLVTTWDDRFRVPGRFGIGTDTHKVPDHLQTVNVPHKEQYATFEQYMTEYEERERDPVHNRYGHYSNPDAKWDYWRIGGRWRGQQFIKAGVREAGLGELGYEFKPQFHDGEVPGSDKEVDFCRISHLDFDRIDAEARSKAAKFWAEVDQWFSGHEFKDYYDGPRDTMLALGILDCKNADELTGNEYWKKPWQRSMKEGVTRYDVVTEKPSPEKLALKVLAYLNPLRPWAHADAAGWYSRGRMGWFGCGSDTPESNEMYANDFGKWILAGNQNDWVVTVDCHI